MKKATDLPESWLACRLGEVTPYGTTKKIEPSDIPLDAWVLELEDIEKDTSRIIQRFTFRERKSKSTKNRFEPGDVLYGKLRPYLNKVVLADQEGYCTTEVIPLKATQAVESRYLFYWLKHPVFLDYVNEVSHGLNMPRLGTDAGKAAPFILAPLAEQKRIADKLEAVLGRVDACRARLDRVPALLKRFRQSVLASATSGRLTAEWRATNQTGTPWLAFVSENPIGLPSGYKRLSKQSFKPTLIDHDAKDLPEGWCVQTVSELYASKCLIDFADGNHGGLYPRKEEFGIEGALFLTATQMDNAWGIALNQCPRLNWKKAKQLTKGWAKNDDVLLSHNATVGRVGILEGTEEDVLLGTSVTFYRFNPKCVLPRFARIVFSSRFFQDQLESAMEQTTRDQVPITKHVAEFRLRPDRGTARNRPPSRSPLRLRRPD